VQSFRGKKSFRDKAPARAAGTDEPGKWDDRETGATHFKLTALPV
jgi:hypothetical protein